MSTIETLPLTKCFSYLCHAFTNDPHSFPTRRSSDLVLREAQGETLWAYSPGFNLNSALCRSEEHTSELQSRGHLVCRLLLEKKKLMISYLLVVEQHRTQLAIHAILKCHKEILYHAHH